MKDKKIFPATSAPPPTHDQIAALAHAIWLDRGQPEGRDREHWFEAERQLRGVVEPLVDQDELDPGIAPAGRIERALDRVAGAPSPRSPTSM